MLNFRIMFNVLHISPDFHNTKQFFHLTFYIFSNDIQEREAIKNNGLAEFGILFFFTETYRNYMFTYLFIVHARDLTRD